MKEKIIERNGEKAIEVRSDGGKILFIKTKSGYEMKCPRTKQICLVSYKEMYSDCLSCWAEKPNGKDNPFFYGTEVNGCELKKQSEVVL